MKLKNSQIQNLHAVLSRLEPLDKPAFVFSGKVRYNIARSLKLLGNVLEVVETVRVKMVRERLKDGQTELVEPARADFIRSFGEVLETESELTLYPVTVAELDLDKNQIPMVLLAELIGKMVVDDKA